MSEEDTPKIPGYELDKPIGTGGQASVYLGTQLSMSRPVAIKVIPPGTDAQATELGRFMREAKVLARMRHDNIVQAIDFGEADDVRYLVMEFVEGDTVLDLIEERGALGVKESCGIALQMARALDHAAQFEVMHRDIKPANIIITKGQRAVLVDFGLARPEQCDQQVTEAGVAVGTPHYMSPEQIRGVDALDLRVDIYALGGTFFHMLTGRAPFARHDRTEILISHLKDPVRLPDDMKDEIPDHVFAIVLKAMAKDPDKRYQKPAEMISDLEEAIEERDRFVKERQALDMRTVEIRRMARESIHRRNRELEEARTEVSSLQGKIEDASEQKKDIEDRRPLTQRHREVEAEGGALTERPAGAKRHPRGHEKEAETREVPATRRNRALAEGPRKTAKTPPEPGFGETVRHLRSLVRELREVRELAAESEAACRTARPSEERDFGRRKMRLEERFEAEREAIEERGFQERRRLKALREDRRARVVRAAAGIREALNDELLEERLRRDAEVARGRELLGAENAGVRTPREQHLRRWLEIEPRVREQREDVEAVLKGLAAHLDVARTDPSAGLAPIDLDADPALVADRAQVTFEQALFEAEKAGGWWGAGLTRTGPLVFYHSLVLLVGIGAAWLAIRLGADRVYAISALAGLTIVTGLLHIASRCVRRRYDRIAGELSERTRHQALRFERHAAAAREQLENLYVESAEAHSNKLEQAEQRVRRESRARSADVRRELEEIQARADAVVARLVKRHADQVQALEVAEESSWKALRADHEAEMERDLEAHRNRLRTVETENAELVRKLHDRRESAVADFSRFRAAIRETLERQHLPWDEMDPRRVELPRAFPDLVPFGELRVSTEGLLEPAAGSEAPGEFRVRVATTYPEYGSLLVEHSPGDRQRALEILTNFVLRALTSFPAGKVRLTILDPVGLGQSFSALMHLADHDEDLVSGRIWTETRHFESRLADLTEHIEKVIQKYLRNRYRTIADFNAEAGELQEPYHFLVIADFPTAFNDPTAERLASILSSGPRCGVYTLIANDIRQEAPSPIDPGLLRRNGPALSFVDGRCTLLGNRIEGEEFLPERPPAPEFASALLDRVGALSVDAAHVELPFAAVTPDEGALWSGSTRGGIRVPVGRTGAERLQYLDLGRGTAQHALIAGRTGSGKSTLFHVMITNLSLWFSPEEIEFYLVDFKKGVEFKPYATHGLPHARVVAIESDREFGLSVLRAIDAELARRGDLFRARGVQDLAAYRRSKAEAPLPRTMLLIDEFQEFFTDDDAVAHDSAMLLDRFVRQGRAFGIHVVLGSQTLSGIYTLARGTLGQMGVRIALQCNESDSYLILSEDNGVARLLSRPGEAIYNDKSGLLEGNNPFQVVWLSEGEQRELLTRLKARAAETPTGPARETVVFEGNQPAKLEENSELAALIEEGPTVTGGDDRVWLGDPNAIKGPTEARFQPASSSNLLIVGQQREGAFALLASAVLSLSAQHRPDDLRIVILDGGGHAPEFAAHFGNLFAAVPHRMDRYDLRTSPDAVAEVAEVVKAREEGGDDRSPIFLFAFGLQRLRMLRREDDFSMSFGEDAKEETGEQFASILTDGPPQNVHTIIWCDTVPNLQRTLSRKTMREFDMRVLFQMSAADSSELIESSAANRLGLSTALLAVESQGTFEKFRPYAIPDRELMRRLGGGVGPPGGSRTRASGASHRGAGDRRGGRRPGPPPRRG